MTIGKIPLLIMISILFVVVISQHQDIQTMIHPENCVFEIPRINGLDLKQLPIPKY